MRDLCLHRLAYLGKLADLRTKGADACALIQQPAQQQPQKASLWRNEAGNESLQHTQPLDLLFQVIKGLEFGFNKDFFDRHRIGWNRFGFRCVRRMTPENLWIREMVRFRWLTRASGDETARGSIYPGCPFLAMAAH